METNTGKKRRGELVDSFYSNTYIFININYIIFTYLLTYI